MTTIAIVVGSVFAYVVVAIRVARWAERVLESAVDGMAAGLMWPFAILPVVAIAVEKRYQAWADEQRRRSKLPEARVRR